MIHKLLILLTVSGCLGAADAEANPYANLRYWYPLPKATSPQIIEADVVAYGATPAGVTAVVQATRMGKTAVLVEFGTHVGGLTSSGLSATDGGKAIGGLAVEFYRRVGKRRGFLPAEAEAAFRAMLTDAKVPVFTERRLEQVVKVGTVIRELVMENGDRFRGKMFIDATYEGDLFAQAGVSYRVGREANAEFGETLNGIRPPAPQPHQFRFPVDPYVVPGDPSSGILPGISTTAADAPGIIGAADQRVQAYNFRMYLAKMPNAIPFPKPSGYDPKRYELAARYVDAGADGGEGMWDMLQLHVGDSNNQGGFSTDHIGANWDWPEATYQRREEIYQDHVRYQQGFMWFLANDERVPAKVRNRVRKYGLDPRNFAETGGWPHQLYIREARRLQGIVVMTEKHCRHRETVEDSVGLGEYNMDSHNTQRFIDRSGPTHRVLNEGDVQVSVPGPYPVSYRAMVPKAAECTNLLVPVCLSSTHIAYGSIRMEPVFMVLGQSAATAAVIAIDDGIEVQQLSYAKLRARLDQDGQQVAADSGRHEPLSFGWSNARLR